MEKMNHGEETDNKKKISIGKNSTGMDFLIIGEILVIGLAEIAHLTASVLKWPFTRCSILFWVLTGAAVAAAIVGFFLFKKHSPQASSGEQEQRGHVFGAFKPEGSAEGVLCAVSAIMVMTQILYLCGEGNLYRQGDMTVETVESFLYSDGLYQVNPMTGMPYTQGMPFRLKILCLPTLYGSICRITSLNPDTVVRKIIPVITLLSCYAAYAALGNCLFAGKENRKKRLCFLSVISLLLWAGAYMYGMDGFGILYSGWRGVTIRNGVLVPWLLSLCLRKKWPSAILCVLAEACMVWTLYGMGTCLFVLVGMFIVTCMVSGRILPMVHEKTRA